MAFRVLTCQRERTQFLQQAGAKLVCISLRSSILCKVFWEPMTVDDFREIALSLAGAEEGAHMGAADFRVGGRIFATLASQSQGFGNLMLTPEQQAAFVEELPDVFVPVAGGWGRMGATHIRLAKANKDVLTGALKAAWQIRVEKNGKTAARKKRK